MQLSGSSLSKNSLFPLVLLLVLHLCCWLMLKPVQPKSDDLNYVEHAQDLLNGNYHLDASPKSHRLGVIVPVAFFTALLGSDPHVISLWPLLCSLCTIISLYLLLLRYSDTLTAFLASALLAFNITQITYSASLFPDVIVSLFAFLAIKSVFYGRKETGHASRYAILFTVFFFVGFLCKEIILLILPFVLIVCLSDLRKPNNGRFWKVLSLSFIAGGVIFMGCYYLLSGDLFFLYHSVDKEHNDVFVRLNDSELFARLTYAPVKWIYSQLGYVILFILALSAVISSLRKGKGFDDLEYFFAIYFLALLALFWLGSTSFTRVAPLLLLDRMWMLLLVPLVILSAGTLRGLALPAEKSSYQLTVVFLFIAAGMIALHVSYSRSVLFLLFAVTTYLTWILKGQMSERMSVRLLLSPYLFLAAWFVANNSGYFH